MINKLPLREQSWTSVNNQYCQQFIIWHKKKALGKYVKSEIMQIEKEKK